MDPNHNEPQIPSSAERRRTLLAAALAVVAASAAIGGSEETFRDPDWAPVQMKGFISDMESLQMTAEPEMVTTMPPPAALQLPKGELPATTGSVSWDSAELNRLTDPSLPGTTTQTVTEKGTELAATAFPRSGTPPEPSSAATSGSAVASAFPPVLFGKDPGSASEPTPPSTGQKIVSAESEAEEEPGAREKSDPEEKRKGRTSKAAAAKLPEARSPAGRTAGEKLPSKDVAINRSGSRASRKGKKMLPLPVAAETRNEAPAVEGRITALRPRADGLLHVTLMTRSEETVQVVIAGGYAGQSLQNGEYVRLPEDCVTRSKNLRPLLEADARLPLVSAHVSVPGDPLTLTDPLPVVGPVVRPVLGPVLRPVLAPLTAAPRPHHRPGRH